MNPDDHARAGRLTDAQRVEGVSDAERAWLDGHLAQCAACQARADDNEYALRMLRFHAAGVSPSVLSVTQARVRLRSRDLQEDQSRVRGLWMACALSWMMGVVTAPLLWQAIAWLGSRLDLSRMVWVTTFAFCWLAPATIAGAAMAWRHLQSSRVNE